MTSQQHPPYGESLRDKYVPQQKVRNDSVGAVFRALDKANGDVVAWLELYRQFSYVEPKTLKRLSEVADQAKKIQHPSVVNVIDFQLD